MPQSNLGVKTFTSGAALTRALRVKFSAGTVVVAGAGEEGIGATVDECDSGDPIAVCLDNQTTELTASGAITQGDDLYAAAAGATSATISGRRTHIAMEDAADGEIFEAMIAGVNS